MTLSHLVYARGVSTYAVFRDGELLVRDGVLAGGAFLPGTRANMQNALEANRRLDTKSSEPEENDQEQLALLWRCVCSRCATQEPRSRASTGPEPEVKPAPASSSAARAEAEAGSRKGHLCRHPSDSISTRPSSSPKQRPSSTISQQNPRHHLGWSSQRPCRCDRLRRLQPKLSVRRAEGSRPICSKGIERPHLHEGKGREEPLTGDKCKSWPRATAAQEAVACLALDRRARSRSSAHAAETL